MAEIPEGTWQTVEPIVSMDGGKRVFVCPVCDHVTRRKLTEPLPKKCARYYGHGRHCETLFRFTTEESDG